MKNQPILYLFMFFFTVCCILPAAAQSHISTQPHQDTVTDLINCGTGSNASFFSSGKDGFIIRWTSDGLGEHYQLSDIGISDIVCSPDGEDIAVYETDGGTINRISVWNWKSLTHKYSIRFNTSITFLAFSENGTYLMTGTASVDGVLFFNASTGSKVNLLQDNTGIVTAATTSSTENTVVMYSPSGTLTYYNLKNGKSQIRFTVEPDLTHPLLFNNNMLLAGIKNNTIYVIQSTTGKLLKTIPASSPLLLSSKTDTDLYYLAYDGRLYTLNIIQKDGNADFRIQKAVKTYKTTDRKNNFSTGIKSGNMLLLGTTKGAVYKSDISSSASTALEPVTNDTYDKIIDISQAGDNFYFLTKQAIFRSSYDSGVVDKIAENNKQTNIITYGKKIILWSKNTRMSVQMLDTDTGTSNILFTPENIIQTLHCAGNILVDIEGNSIIKSFNIESMSQEELYTGAGLQDIVLYTDRDLYVAKSSATRPESALIYINTQTKETVPLPLSGTIAYSLCYDNTSSDSDIYGMSVSEDSGNGKTTLFSFTPKTNQSVSVLELQEEDSNAMINLYYPCIYTTLGKNQLQSFNLQTKSDFLYKRSASMPLKTARNEKRLVVLNRDGSISWYNPESANILADWYLTLDGHWFEF
jgi:hypothetical protein